MLKAWARGLFLIAPLLGGCGVGEGDYVVFRVAVAEVQISPACFPEDDPEPLEDQLSSSTYLTPLTWVIYYGAGDKVLLDAAGISIGGEETADGFTFVGHDVDVTYGGIDNLEAKITVTTATTVTIEESGTAIQGEAVDVVTTTCDFLTATPSSGLCSAISNCERRTKFSGVELEDVRVGTVTDRSNPL